MKLYFPKAKQKYPDPLDFHKVLYTYDPIDTLEKCGKCFDNWENFYGWKLEEMWVDVEDTETGEKTKIIFERKYAPKEEN